MSPPQFATPNRPLLVLLHWLGGGAQTWQEVSHGLDQRGLRCVPLDLPGFGQAASEPATDVASAAASVINSIRSLRASAQDAPWLLAGHSMGGKIAAAIARRALDGEPGLEDLRALILVSPSPPSPEPIEDSRRADHLQTWGQPTDPVTRRQNAAEWVDHNTGPIPLPPAVRDRAIEGILAIPPSSFQAWFLQGSKEDSSTQIGTLPLPTLMFTGTEETSLGLETQRTDTLPHLPRTTLISLEKAKHLGPLERPAELIEHITEFLTQLNIPLATTQARPGPTTEALLHSVRTSPTTRNVMTQRLAQNGSWNHQPLSFTPAEFRTLRALAQAIVPDAGLDLAACVDAQLTADQGDGWRYAALPPDPEAWRRGLRSLDLAAKQAHEVPFLSLHPDQQHALLTEAAKGKLGPGILARFHGADAKQAFDPETMQQWIEDVRAELTRFYIADPRTMHRIGYTGFADELGFTQIHLGQQEEFSS